MDIGINWGAFPPLADAAGLETAADSLRTHARGFAQIIWDNRDTWKGLGATFESPDAGTLLAVLNPNEPRADDVFTDTNKAADALDEFAATERGLATEKDALHGQYQSLLNEIGDNAEWVKDEGLVQRQQGIVDAMNDLISRHQSAEMTCANAINALYGGTRYVQVSADGSVPEGAEAYGMTREMLNSASGAGETPWAKPAEWDKPWYRDVVDGVVDFGSGVWESLKGTVTGLVALVNPFDWETFSATWKGIGTLATDIAVTATPVGAFVSDERRAQSGERLVQVGEALLNVEMWKENPAKAAGMLTGDLLTAVVPVGAGAKGASKVAGAVRAAGGAREVATAAKFKAAFKAEDFARGFSDKKFALTSSLQAKSAGFAYRHPGLGAAASTVRTAWNFDVDAAARTFTQGMRAKVPALAALPGGGAVWVSSGEKISAVMSRAMEAGVAPTRTSGSMSATLVESRGHMVFRESRNWTDGNRTWDRKSDAQRAETYEHLEIKSGQLSDMAAGQKAVRSTGDVEITQRRSGLGFTDTVARQQKRSDFLDPESILQKDPKKGPVLNETMRARVLSELEAEARADKGHDRRAAAETWEELPPYLQERAVRRAMRDYDLDHVRDLQFGGTDTADNLQWLERSANRAVGAQSKVHRERFDYETSKDADAFDEKSRVSKVSLKVGR